MILDLPKFYHDLELYFNIDSDVPTPMGLFRFDCKSYYLHFLIHDQLILILLI